MNAIPSASLDAALRRPLWLALGGALLLAAGWMIAARGVGSAQGWVHSASSQACRRDSDPDSGQPRRLYMLRAKGDSEPDDRGAGAMTRRG